MSMFTKPCPACKEVVDMKVGQNVCPKCNKPFICMDDITERRLLNSLKSHPRRKVK